MNKLYPWQQSQWQQVMNVCATGSTHALLLQGAAGLGKVDFARRLVNWMLCEQAKQQGLSEACGQCSACHLSSGGTHPDFIELTTEEKSQFIVVDQVRTLVDKVNRTSMRDGYQVVLIQPADCLNISAANALLKTLEEPNGRVLFILVTSQLHKLLPTIISRCQAVSFSSKENELMLTWLQQQLPVAENARQMLELANNAPLLAMQLVEEDYLKTFNHVSQCLLDVVSNKLDPVSAAEQMLKHEAKWVVRAGLSLVVDMIRIKMKIPVHCLSKSPAFDPLSEVVHKITLVSLFNYYDMVKQSFSLWLGNIKVNESLMIESVLLQWQQLSRSHT